MGYVESLILLTVIFSIFSFYLCIAVVKKRKYSYLPVNIATYIFYLIFLFLQYKLNFRVRIFIILFVLMTITGNNYVGLYLDYYQRSKYYDRYLHAFGSFSFALFFYSILDKIIMITVNSDIYTAIFIAALGISLGCIFEIGEFIVDDKTNSGHQHGLRDTNFDLISNVIGSIAAGVISMWITL